jgi:hypothetical protein
MTVISNSYIKQPATFSEEEIGAATKAFMQYDREQQTRLLTIMPVEEAVGVLAHCRQGYVKPLIKRLELQGHKRRAQLFVTRLDQEKKRKDGQVQDKGPGKKGLLTFLTLFTVVAGSGIYYMLSHNLLQLPLLAG